jgi:hypothetical protein
MRHRHSLLLAAFVIAQLATPALAGSLRFVGEHRFDHGVTTLKMLSANRFVMLGFEWERPPGRPPIRHTMVFDLETQASRRVTIPVERLTASDPRIPVTALPDVLHHDGKTSTVLFDVRTGEANAYYLCRFDHEAQAFTTPVLIAERSGPRFFRPVGFDPFERFFYFGIEVHGERPSGLEGAKFIELARVELKTQAIDWRMTLTPHARTPRLRIDTVATFDHGGTRIAFVEYNDSGMERKRHASPPQQMYVVDVAGKRTDAYPTPLTTYGVAFSRDDRFLLLGSSSQAEIQRVDLAKKRLDARVRAVPGIHAFFVSPSGRSLLTIPNTARSNPKVLEARWVDSMTLAAEIPVRHFLPGVDTLAPGSFAATFDGRFLVAPVFDQSGFPLHADAQHKAGIRVYAVADVIDAPNIEGSDGDALELAQAWVAAEQAGAARQVTIPSMGPPRREQTGAFLPVVVTPRGEVTFIGTRSGNSDGDYKPGRTLPVIFRLRPSGQVAWERPLPLRGYLDHEASSVQLTIDGHALAFVHSYRTPGSTPVSRIVKLSPSGKVLWDTIVTGARGRMIVDEAELRKDGVIALRGRLTTESKDKRRWSGVMDLSGALISETVVGEGGAEAP